METDLETLFDRARATPPAVPSDLAARVLADAKAVQGKRPFWERWVDLLGGTPGLGGLVTATCVGIWLGVSPPANFPDLAGQVLGIESASELEVESGNLTGFGWDVEEG